MLGFTAMSIVSYLKPISDPNIIFNVTGIVNATNSSIAIVQLDCIKYCIDNVRDEYDSKNDCMDRCLKIGECK